MDGAIREVLAIFSGVIVLAIIATLVSRNAQTGNILTSAFKGLGNAITAAEAPVTGASGVPNYGSGNNIADLFPNLNTGG